MSNPTVTVLSYMTLAGSPLAQAGQRPRECRPHEWRDLEGDEDEGVEFVMIEDGQLTSVRPCTRCDAAELRITGRDGGVFGLVLLRSGAVLAATK